MSLTHIIFIYFILEIYICLLKVQLLDTVLNWDSNQVFHIFPSTDVSKLTSLVDWFNCPDLLKLEEKILEKKY